MSDLFILSLIVGVIFLLCIVKYMVETGNENDSDDDSFIMW